MARDGDPRSRSGRGLVLGLMLAVLGSGCQTAMSIDEARKVAATFGPST